MIEKTKRMKSGEVRMCARGVSAWGGKRGGTMPGGLLSAALALASVAACAFGGESGTQGGKAMALELKSAAFNAGGNIPKKFTCDGPDVSPQLNWDEPPANTQSLALVMDDPDAPAGTWVHWVLFNLPAATRELAEGVPKDQQLPSGALQGLNDFRRVGYGGPCPPAGKPHRYFFKLYALDGRVGLKAGATKKELEGAMQGHILAQGELMGRYGR